MKNIFKKTILSSVLIFSTQVFSAPKIEDSISKFNWNGIDVVFIEDNRFPTYDMTIYFADGALSDTQTKKGLTTHAFNLVDAGTEKLSQKEILDQIEFYGTEFNVDVTHEYSTLSVAGLSKDFNPTMSTLCSLLREANYPSQVVKNELDKEKSMLNTLVSSPKELSDRIFRELTLGQTPYAYPVSGKLADLDKFESKDLRAHLDYYLNKVKKRIYLTGPKSILSIQKVLNDKCQLVGHSDDFVRSMNYKKKIGARNLVFVPVPDANQVQVKFGKFLNYNEIQDRNLGTLASEFLGGGFTSRLMREVRVKRGLTYSIGSYVSSQKQYGRAGISTFTKNETINRLVEVIDETVSKIKKQAITKEELEHSRGAIVGSHPFKFESNRAFLSELIYLDHTGRNYSELFNFNDSVQKYSEKDVGNYINNVFGTDSQIIFILGDKSLEKELRKLEKKFGKLTILNYKKFI